jgi:hypothetical protein
LAPAGSLVMVPAQTGLPSLGRLGTLTWVNVPLSPPENATAIVRMTDVDGEGGSDDDAVLHDTARITPTNARPRTAGRYSALAARENLREAAWLRRGAARNRGGRAVASVHVSPRSRDILGRYAMAIAAVLLTLAIKLLLFGFGSEHPFVLFPAAVALAAWYGGLGPGVLATLLVTVASAYLLLPPVGSGAEPTDFVAMGGLVVESAVVVALTVGLRSARSRAEAERAASVVAHRETAFALAVRDEMLTLWTQELRGPLADLEAQARAALDDIEHEGYSGAAGPKIRKLVDEASLVGRATAGWDVPEEPNR